MGPATPPGPTVYRLDQVMAGDLAEIVDALVAADQAARLAEMVE